LEGSRIEFGRAQMSFGVVGSSYTLARDSQEVGIQFAIRILIVKDRYRVPAWLYPGEFAESFTVGNRRSTTLYWFLTVFWEPVGGGIESAEDVPLVVMQTHNFDMDQASLRRPGLWQATFERQQRKQKN